MKKWFRIVSSYIKYQLDRLIDWKRFVDWFARLENERIYRENSRRLRKQIEAAKKIEQDNCPHRAGSSSLSEQCIDLTSIVWHVTDIGVTVGICTNCQRQFWPKDADYLEWRKKKSFNQISAAGQRLGFNGSGSGLWIGSDAEQEDYAPCYLQDELYAKLEEERLKYGTYAIPAEGLDALPDKEIEDLFEGVRELRRKERGDDSEPCDGDDWEDE